MRYPVTLVRASSAGPRRIGTSANFGLALNRTMREAVIQLRDADGAPIVGATVKLGLLTAQSDAAGVARFRVAPGRHTLAVSADGFDDETRTEAL